MGRDALAGGASPPQIPQTVGTSSSFSLTGHRTSVALEMEFWTVLAALAEEDGIPLSVLVGRVDAARSPGQPLASALRLTALSRGK